MGELKIKVPLSGLLELAHHFSPSTLDQRASHSGSGEENTTLTGSKKCRQIIFSLFKIETEQKDHTNFIIETKINR